MLNLGGLALLAATVAGTFTYTLPSREAAGCGEAAAPLTDLDSTYLYRQDQTLFPQPRIIKRAGVRGMEGWPWSFTYACDTPPCQYFVTTKDIAGNESCPSDIQQVGGTTDVPPASPTSPTIWFDVAGRRVRDTRAPGVYVSNRGERRITLR